MSRRQANITVALLLLVASATAYRFPEVRAAVTASVPVAWLLSTPDPMVDADRGEQTIRGWRAMPTPEPTPRATPVKPDKPTPEPTRRTVQAVVQATVRSLVWPVRGHITTYYSAAHPAIDIAAPCGTPVKAPASGTVTWATWRNNGGGNVIDLNIGWAVVSLNHLSGYAVRSGRVIQGQVVGYVGMTGNATGCHVHLELWSAAIRRNPLHYLP